MRARLLSVCVLWIGTGSLTSTSGDGREERRRLGEPRLKRAGGTTNAHRAAEPVSTRSERVLRAPLDLCGACLSFCGGFMRRGGERCGHDEFLCQRLLWPGRVERSMQGSQWGNAKGGRVGHQHRCRLDVNKERSEEKRRSTSLRWPHLSPVRKSDSAAAEGCLFPFPLGPLRAASLLTRPYRSSPTAAYARAAARRALRTAPGKLMEESGK